MKEDVVNVAVSMLLEMRGELKERMSQEVIACITERNGSPIPDELMAWLSPCIELCAHEAMMWFAEKSAKYLGDK